MDNSQKSEVSVTELAGPKPQASDRMAKPQELTREIEVEPQPIVMDRMATLEVSSEDPHVLTKDLIEELSNVVTKDIIVDPQDPVADKLAPVEGLTKDIIVDPQDPVADNLAPAEGLTKDLVVQPQTHIEDKMAPHEVVTKDLIIEDPPALTLQAPLEPSINTLEASLAPSINTLEAPLAPSINTLEAPLAPSINTLEAPLAPSINTLEAPLAPSINTLEAPLAPSINTLEAPLAPSINTLEAPLAPSINTLEAPLAPSISTLEAPLAPVVDTLEKPLIAALRPQVTIHQGRIEGLGLKTDSGFAYKAFLGIPYAKPPIGNLRFKDPLPSDRWEGVRDATVEGNDSPQIEILKNTFRGKEDCLYLNVYTPQGTTTDSDLPVMFWIHGGGFQFGSGGREWYGPDFLVDKHIVLVTINYRLGPLGFLCLNTAECPGNAGLKDQVMALKWVNDNIRQFGGNPKNITIFGESAGSVSAHYLTMSPMAKGLFGKAIFQSGSSASEWLIDSDPMASATRLAELLGFKNSNNRNIDDLSRFLTNVQYESLIKAANAPEFRTGNEKSFLPVIEKRFPPKKAIITESARELQRIGKYNKVPTISGVTSNEGVLFMMTLAGLNLETITLDQLVPNFQNYIPKELKSKLNAAKRYVAANKIKEFYFATTDNLVEKFCTLMSDFSFIRDTEYSVKMFSKVVPATYYYRFSYAGSLNTMKRIVKVSYSGAAHGDDLRYFFKPSSEELKQQVASAQDIAVIQSVTELWTNFARTGNPTPALSDNIKTLWKPVTEKELNCYDISEDSTLIQNPFLERAKFWDELNTILTN